jgi:fibronectin type 3 domain-containing protein
MRTIVLRSGLSFFFGPKLPTGLALVFLVLLTAACGHRSSNNDSNAIPTPDVPAALAFAVSMQPQASIVPPFKGTGVVFDAPVEMEASGAAAPSPTANPLDQPANAFQTAWQTSNVVASGGVAVFSPNWTGPSSAPAGIAACCYRFELGQYPTSSRKTLALSWDPEQRLQDVETQCCIGISDWSRNAWEWFAGPADGTLTLEALAPYIGAEGETLMMIVVMGSAPAALERLTVGAPEMRGAGLVSESTSGDSSFDAASEFRSASVDFPASFDLTAEMPPVRDQGVLASSTAFAIGDGAFAHELNRLYAASGWDIASSLNKVSPKYLYVEGGIAGGLPQPSCPDSGRTLSAVFTFLRDSGVAADLHAPYQSPFCNDDWSTAALADAPLLKIFSFASLASQTSTTINGIKSILTTQRPVVIGLQFDQAFVDYQPGDVWDFVGPALGGQALVVVGYDDAKQAFKVRNSWGTAWGEDGYAFLNYRIFSSVTGAALERCFSLKAEFKQGVVTRFCPAQALTPPTNVQATNGITDRVRVTWSAVSGATSYKVSRSSNLTGGGTFTQIGTTTTLQFDDPQSVTTAFLYKVRSSNTTGDSAFSSSNAGNASFAAPTGVTATDGTHAGVVVITWSAVSNAAGYKVFRASSSSGTYVQIGATSSTSQGFGDFQPLTSVFFYKVKATAPSGAGDSGLSTANAGNVSLAAPTGIAASDGTFTGHIRISWNAVAGATAYKVYQDIGANTFEELGITSALQFDDHAARSTGLVTFTVSALTGTDESARGVADTGHNGLASPGGVAATDGTFTDRVRVTWNAVPTATSYKIFRADVLDELGDQIGTTSALQFDDAPTTADQFIYSVKASTAAGDSSFFFPNFGNAGLAAPTGVTATDGTFTDHVHVTWNEVDFASNFKVFRASTPTGSYTLVGTVFGNLQFDDVPPPGANFFYKVKTFTTPGDSALSALDGGFTKLSAPTGVTATDGTLADRVRITWNAVEGANSYNVSRSTSAAGTFTQIAASNVPLAFDDFRSVTSNFFYKIRAEGAAGDSGFSFANVGHAGAAPPTDVSATDGTLSDRIRVSWSAVSGAQSYKVGRATSATGPFEELLTTVQTQFDQTSGITAPFFYVVQTVNAVGKSSLSVAEAGFVGIGAPTITATDGALSDRVRVSWPAVAGATSYKVARSAAAAGPFALILTTAETSFDHTTSLTSPFFYKVAATKAIGDSVFSLVESGSAGLASPTNVSASDGTLNGRIRITWTAAPGAAGYEIFRATTAGGQFTPVGTAAGAATQFDNLSVPTGTFFYKVRTTAASGNSGFSNIDSGFRQ